MTKPDNEQSAKHVPSHQPGEGAASAGLIHVSRRGSFGSATTFSFPPGPRSLFTQNEDLVLILVAFGFPSDPIDCAHHSGGLVWDSIGCSSQRLSDKATVLWGH